MTHPDRNKYNVGPSGVSFINTKWENENSSNVSCSVSIYKQWTWSLSPPFVGATSVLPSVFPMFGQFLTKNVFLVSTWEGAKGKERWGRDQN